MQGTSPRTLSNRELIKYSAMLIDSGQPLPIDWATELLRRLNYDTDGRKDQTASVKDTRQLELPL